MELQKIISERQERNREKFSETFGGVMLEAGKPFPEFLDQLTTDTAHAVALVVIKELLKEENITTIQWYEDITDRPEQLRVITERKLRDHLSTLEQSLQDNK